MVIKDKQTLNDLKIDFDSYLNNLQNYELKKHLTAIHNYILMATKLKNKNNNVTLKEYFQKNGLNENLDFFKNIKNKYSFQENGKNIDYYLSEEYNGISNLFKHYNWSEDLLDSFLTDDIDEFTKKSDLKYENFIRNLGLFKSSLKTTIERKIQNKDIIDNIEDILNLLELNDSQLLEFKNKIDIYILSKDFDNDKEEYEKLSGKDFIVAMLNNIQKRLLIYVKEPNSDNIKEVRHYNDKDKNFYHINKNGKIILETQKSGVIDNLYLSDNNCLYGSDVTADKTGKMDKESNVRKNSLQIIRHYYKDYLSVKEFLIKKLNIDIKPESFYYFQPDIIVENTTDLINPLKEFNKLKSKNKSVNKKLENKEIITEQDNEIINLNNNVKNVIELIHKNWIISEPNVSNKELIEDRGNVKTLIKMDDVNQNKIRYNQNLSIENKSLLNFMSFISLINNYEDFKKILNEYLNILISTDLNNLNDENEIYNKIRNNPIFKNVIKESSINLNLLMKIDINEILKYIKTITKIYGLNDKKNQFEIFEKHSKKEQKEENKPEYKMDGNNKKTKEQISIILYESIQLMLGNKNYKNMLALELLIGVKNMNLHMDLSNQLMKTLFIRDNKYIFHFEDIQNEIKLRETSSKLNETSSKLNETSDKLNETSSKLNETSSKLNETSDKLNETSSKLNETSDKLNETSDKLNINLEKLNKQKTKNIEKYLEMKIKMKIKSDNIDLKELEKLKKEYLKKYDNLDEEDYQEIQEYGDNYHILYSLSIYGKSKYKNKIEESSQEKMKTIYLKNMDDINKILNIINNKYSKQITIEVKETLLLHLINKFKFISNNDFIKIQKEAEEFTEKKILKAIDNKLENNNENIIKINEQIIQDFQMN
jgi:hypothetical protein